MLSMIVFYGLILVFVLAVIAAIVAAPILAYNYVSRLDRLMPVIVTCLAGGLLILSGVLNARNLQYATFGAAFIESEGSVAYFWISRLTSAVLVGLCVPYLFAKFMIFLRDNKRIYWPVLIIILFALTNYILPSILGTKPGFDHRLMYPILIMLVLLVSAPGIQATISIVKWSLAVFFALSLAFIAIEPNRVLAPGYHGFIPWLHSRFWGLASHANAIAPMAVLCLLLELFIPSRVRLVRITIIVMSIVVIILAQSKTAIVAAVLGWFIVFYWHNARKYHILGAGSFIKLHLGQVTLYFGALLILLGLLLGSFTGVIDDLMVKISSSKLGSDVQTLTGRDVIWKVALAEWLRNPLFGYGTSIWNLDYRLHVGLNYAFHAHNQFIHTLAESGIVGLLGLLLFFAAIIVAVYQARLVTDGASLAIFTLLFLRSITEVPLRPSGIGTGEMLLMITIAYIWRLSYLAPMRTQINN